MVFQMNCTALEWILKALAVLCRSLQLYSSVYKSIFCFGDTVSEEVNNKSYNNYYFNLIEMTKHVM